MNKGGLGLHIGRLMCTFTGVALVFLLFGTGMGAKLVEGGISGELALSIVLVILMTLTLLLLVIFLAVRMAIISALSRDDYPMQVHFVSSTAKRIIQDFEVQGGSEVPEVGPEEVNQETAQEVCQEAYKGNPNRGFDVNSIPAGAPGEE